MAALSCLALVKKMKISGAVKETHFNIKFNYRLIIVSIYPRGLKDSLRLLLVFLASSCLLPLKQY